MTELEKRLWMCLLQLAEQADEDCPQHHRTTHFNEALRDADYLINEMWALSKKLNEEEVR
jgi:hypothetical protein